MPQEQCSPLSSTGRLLCGRYYDAQPDSVRCSHVGTLRIAPTPRHRQLLKIAEVEGVSMDWLLNGTGEVPVLEIKNQK